MKITTEAEYDQALKDLIGLEWDDIAFKLLAKRIEDYEDIIFNEVFLV